MTTVCLADSYSDTGTYYYRVELPYRHLRSPLAERGITLVRGPQPACDVYVYSQIIAAESLKLAFALKNVRKARFVFGLDDHPWQMPKNYPNPKKWDEIRALRRRQLSELASEVITTTVPLKETLPAPWRTDAIVLPNLIDPADYQPVAREDGALNVVFAGSPSHEVDVKVLVPAIRAAEQQFPNAVFSFLGCKPPPALAAPFDRQRHRLKWFPWVRTPNYPRALCALRPDVALCPLIDDEFTRCKSNIKMLEGTLAGAACLVSKSTTYTDCPGVVCENEPGRRRSWENELSVLLGAPEQIRRRETHLTRDWVLNNFSWAKDTTGQWRSPHAARWELFFLQLASKT